MRFWNRALSDDDVKVLSAGKAQVINTPDVNWTPQPGVATFPKGIAGVPTTIALDRNGTVRQIHVGPLSRRALGELLALVS